MYSGGRDTVVALIKNCCMVKNRYVRSAGKTVSRASTGNRRKGIVIGNSPAVRAAVRAAARSPRSGNCQSSKGLAAC